MLRQLFISAVAVFTLYCTTALGQAQTPQKPTIKRAPAERITSLEGKDLFQTYCAVCHGVEGKGNGPAAPALKTPPADLTTITKRKGRFSATDVEESITGRNLPPAHGSREMPMWGRVFRETAGDPDIERLAISNLVKYLQSLQAK
jgi:mono/diheme cytochrome c family protein